MEILRKFSYKYTFLAKLKPRGIRNKKPASPLRVKSGHIVILWKDFTVPVQLGNLPLGPPKLLKRLDRWDLSRFITYESIQIPSKLK